MAHEIDPGQVLIARHPIFDSQQRVIAYELNYHRDTSLNDMLAADPDAMAASPTSARARATSVSSAQYPSGVPIAME